MRLLFFISSMRAGGAERVMSVLCNNLVERGHEVHLCVNTREESLYHLNERIVQHAWQVKTTRSKVLNILRYFKNIRSVATLVKPDVLISFVWPLNAIVLLAMLGKKVPIIASEHNTFKVGLSFKAIVCRFFINRLASAVTVLTQADYDYIGNRLKKKVVIPNPLPFEIYEGEKKREKIVLAMGSLIRYHHKGFDNLIRIWGKIAIKFPDWRLEIAGGWRSDSLSYLKQLVEENGVTETVIFSGHVEKVAEHMQECSIFVLSSRFEGFGMVLIEAMSQGCACVSFDCKDGPKEIIDNEIDGLLVQDQDMGAMEEALMRLMGNENLRNRISKGGKIGAKKFDADVIVDKWESLFFELIKGSILSKS